MPNTILIVISLIGLILSIYSFYVERKLKKNKDYKPICDISDKLSCSKNFTSKDATIFMLPNSILGIFFYLLVIILTYLNLINYIFYLSIPSILFTIYLAYSSYFKLKNICLICTLTYVINILILVLSYIQK